MVFKKGQPKIRCASVVYRKHRKKTVSTRRLLAQGDYLSKATISIRTWHQFAIPGGDWVKRKQIFVVVLSLERWPNGLTKIRKPGTDTQ
jgi:hypothetical protein